MMQLTAAEDGSSFLDSLRHDTERVVQRPLRLVQDLLSSTAQDY